jgi:hypothetical protein
MSRYQITVDITPTFGDARFLLPNVIQAINGVGNDVVRVVGRAEAVEEYADHPITFAEARAVKERMVDGYLGQPGVAGFGFGRDDHGYFVAAYLEDDSPVLPSSVNGVPIRREVTGPIVASGGSL